MQKTNNVISNGVRELAFEVRNACKTYGNDHQAELEVLRQVSFQVYRGEFLAIVGPSGCGKSTLLDAIANQTTLDSGSIQFAIEPETSFRRRIAVAWQKDALIPWKTVRNNLGFSLLNSELSDDEKQRRIDYWLKAVRLEAFGQYYPAQLSLGMQKRVSLATALVTDPALLLLDEPFAQLDVHTKQQIETELVSLWEEIDTTIVLVTHDIQEAVALSDRI